MIGVSACGGRVLNQNKYAEQQAVGGPFTGPVTRHLMYYLYAAQVSPRSSYAWQEILDEILERIELFNGMRILAIAYSDLSQIDRIREYCGDRFSIYLPIASIPELREVSGFLPCLERTKSFPNENHVVFTAHAKAISHWSPYTERWRQEMTEINLDYWPVVEEALTRGAMCGAFRRYGKFPRLAHTPGEQSEYERWHYSGTFYWMRSKDLFARNWRNMDWTWYGTESYPGVQFSPEQCQCLVGDNCGDLYQPETWDQLQPEIDKWKLANKANHRSLG